MTASPLFGFVVGLAAEARIAAKLGHPVRAGGGTPVGAQIAATRLIADGATALVSFGLAGGLDPVLRPGSIVIPSIVLTDGKRLLADAALAQLFGGLSGHIILAGSVVAEDTAAKRRLRADTKADAIDLESGVVASVADAHGLPFIVVRAICDPAERDLPPAALVALNPNGSVGITSVLRSVLAHPSQIPALLSLARDAGQARRALVRLISSSAERVHTVDRTSSR